MEVSEIQKDIRELQKFETEATRTRVKDFLALQIRRLQTEATQTGQDGNSPLQSGDASTSKTPPSAPRASAASEIIKTYAWDQSDKFMKLYVTLKDVQSVSKDNISCQFTDQSVRLKVESLGNKAYELHIAKLCEKIVPDGSYHKVKTDTVLLMLKKKDGKTWAWVTDREKKEKEMKKPPPTEAKEDPNAGIMKLLQNMYEDGDDEMKRSITKAMYESQNKPKPDFSM